MTFQKYIESTKEFIVRRDRVFQVLSLTSDAANLLEKLKYFKNEHSLIMAEIGDLFFRLFALLDVFEMPYDEDPIDLDQMKVDTHLLDKRYVISEQDLFQTVIFESGIISNIMTENMKYDLEVEADNDRERLKASIYSFILHMLILVCKYNFSIDKILEFSIEKLKMQHKTMNAKKVK